ncbi:flagellar biosynthesis regulator FlaF [Thermopetrobacter sp. TC1]|uniref:flagellar biosynthesis regulator FlaF n=1 Tax=Thermopetrobacter sp. TC1 TaxID=1495045 RepID=UPI000570F226|nr:flagellar biosynthesis regulator FlaF [Thermopetrobacter sp. TC1]
MYKKAYKDIAGEDYARAREEEAMAIDFAIDMLRRGEQQGIRSVEAVKALHFTRRLWLFFLDDLADPANGLPDDLKARLISIGIWVIKELERIDRREQDTFADLIDIMEIIRDGLKT